MAKIVSISELRNMPLDDLHREVREQELSVAKLRMGVHLNKEKDTAKYQREKKQLARMKTVWAEKQRSESTLATTAA